MNSFFNKKKVKLINKFKVLNNIIKNLSKNKLIINNFFFSIETN